MEMNKKMDNFNDIYNKMSRNDKKAVRLEVCQAAGNIEYHSFMRKLRKNNWTMFEREGIMRILKKRGYES